MTSLPGWWTPGATWPKPSGDCRGALLRPMVRNSFLVRGESGSSSGRLLETRGRAVGGAVQPDERDGGQECEGERPEGVREGPRGGADDGVDPWTATSAQPTSSRPSRRRRATTAIWSPHCLQS